MVHVDVRLESGLHVEPTASSTLGAEHFATEAGLHACAEPKLAGSLHLADSTGIMQCHGTELQLATRLLGREWGIVSQPREAVQHSPTMPIQ